MTQNATMLYETDTDKDELWDLYLNSFLAGTNEVYRKRREYDCSCCRQFIRAMGNVVTINGDTVTSIWDFDTKSIVFQPVVDALAAYVRSKAIKDVFYTKEAHKGTKENREMIGDRVYTWSHFYLDIPDRFVCHTRQSEGDFKGTLRGTRDVFANSLAQISEESVNTVLELIAQNSLYRGAEWEAVLRKFLVYIKQYQCIHDQKVRELYTWTAAFNNDL